MRSYLLILALLSLVVGGCSKPKQKIAWECMEWIDEIHFTYNEDCLERNGYNK